MPSKSSDALLAISGDIFGAIPVEAGFEFGSPGNDEVDSLRSPDSCGGTFVGDTSPDLNVVGNILPVLAGAPDKLGFEDHNNLSIEYFFQLDRIYIFAFFMS